jgi:Lhr-like helicase
MPDEEVEKQFAAMLVRRLIQNFQHLPFSLISRRFLACHGSLSRSIRNDVENANQK